MKFAENNRISHRQLYRQIVLTFFAPLLLGIFRNGNVLGLNGIVGILTALILVLFYVIWLIRLAPFYGNLKKTTGEIWGRALGIFFLIYIFLTGAYLLTLLEDMISRILLPQWPQRLLILAVLLVCMAGTGRGMQRRGRIAEVTGGVFLFLACLFLLMGCSQGKLSYVREMVLASPVTEKELLWDFYTGICAFSGIGIMPFVLKDVEKQGSSGKAAVFAILTIGGSLLALEFLLPSVLGWNRLMDENMPVYPLLSSIRFPGNAMAGLDVFWLGMLLFSLLFAIGSIFYYGHQIAGSSQISMNRFWMLLLIYLLYILEINGYRITEYYGRYLAYIFVPGMLLIQVGMAIWGMKKRKKRTIISALSLLLAGLFFCGCGGVEPEDKMYPLALAVDYTEEGFQISYGMPDLPEDTGQSKPEKNNTQILSISGKSFEEIEEKWEQTQEKVPDYGHLEVLLLGKQLIAAQKWPELLAYIKELPQAGEDIFVFQAEAPAGILEWAEQKGGNTAGEYLSGMIENHSQSYKSTAIRLRQIYYEKAKSNTLPELPEVKISEESLYLTAKHPAEEYKSSGKISQLAWWGLLYPQYCFMEPEEESKIRKTEMKPQVDLWIKRFFK